MTTTVRSRRSRVMLSSLFALAALGAACQPPAPVVPTLWEGHVDAPGIAYHDGELELHVHDHSTETEYEADEIKLGVKNVAKTTIAEDANYAFLGESGSDIWILPAHSHSGLLGLGYAAEEVPADVFVGNTLQLSLLDVAGPGSFHLYRQHGANPPNVLFDSDETLPQAFGVPAGAHIHANWAFSAPGIYTVTYEATGDLVAGGSLSTGPVTFTFEVAS